MFDSGLFFAQGLFVDPLVAFLRECCVDNGMAHAEKRPFVEANGDRRGVGVVLQFEFLENQPA